ncbi:MAG: hypothetical protein KGV44_11480 [Flavobacteriaceae bacterium]|nr:hypothetical protein [Flavobacteriaceae bacterium]
MIIDGVEYLDPHKHSETDKIYWLETIEQTKGEILFSFDLKTVYNFFADWDKLTEEQKEIFRKENPILAELKDY